MSDEIKELKDAEQAETSPDAGPNMAWVPGLVMIGIGVIFLLNNFTNFHLNNWWALFILIPAFATLGNFWRAYRGAGRLNHDARGSLIGSMILFFVAAVFLFGWSWGAVWPFFLIIAGLGALLSGLFD
jgi:hypothetical protein